MKKITRDNDIPEFFFLTFLQVDRGKVDTGKLMKRPGILSVINGKEIFILKPGCDPLKFRSYEKCLVELNHLEKTQLPEVFSTEMLVEEKRKQLLEKKEQTFHFLDQVKVTQIFHDLQTQASSNPQASQIKPIFSGLQLPSDNGSKFDAVQLSKRQAQRSFDNLIRQDDLKDPRASARFLVYLCLHDLLEEGSVVLDLEFSQARTQDLIDFEAHVEAVRKEGYLFEEFQLNHIRQRLGLKSKEELVSYFKSLSECFVIIATPFNVKSHGNRSGYYELYFKHPDSAQMGTDVIVSVIVPKTEVTSELKLLYDMPTHQPFKATVVGTVVSGFDFWMDGEYTISITPIMIYT
ncbi:MAG: hypothetical protein AAFY20_01305 [Cyanobacteria bacterium J06639_14]